MISKIVNLKQKYFTILIYIMLMFYNEIPCFYQDFKNENLCFLSLYSILNLSLAIMLVLPNEEQNTFATLKAFPSCRNR